MATRAKSCASSAKRSGPGPNATAASRKAPVATPKRDPLAAFLQAKLTVNAPGDAYEQEADSVAARIMQMPEGERKKRPPPGGSNAGGPVQRQAEDDEAQTAPFQREEGEEKDIQTACAACDEREKMQRDEMEEGEAAQAKPLQREEEEEAQPKPLQREDAAEEDGQAKPLQRQEEEEEAAQAKPLQREEMEEEEAVQAKSLQREEMEEEEAQAKPATARARRRMSAGFETRLRHLKSIGGARMTPSLRGFMESRFGRSFAHVRIHTGADAAHLAQEARARAFTVGRHIVFNRSEYRPDSDSGRRLMAHELTHVLQQKGGLHSVHREIFANEATAPIRTPRGDELLRRLETLFGLDGGQLPPAIQAILSGILRSAATGPDGDTLRPLLADGAIAAQTRRTVAGAEYTLKATVHRSDKGARTDWELLRTGENEPFYTHLKETGASAAVPDGGVDEAQITLATPVPPRYRSDPAVDRNAGRPATAPTPDPVPDTGTPPQKPVDGPDTSALQSPDRKPAKSANTDAGRGDSTGSDTPQALRAPVDQEAKDQVPDDRAPPDIEIKRSAPSGAPAEVTPQAEHAVQSVLSAPGTPLPGPLAAEMTQTVGGDVSGARIHTGQAATRAARAVGARAFALNDRIVFGLGQFQPATRAGRALLAHELTHIRQNAEGRGTSFAKRAEDKCPPPEPVPEVEVVPSPEGPGQDPAFTSMDRRSENRAKNQATHATGETKSDSANDAAEVTEGENRIHGQSDQVATMGTEAANPPAFDRKAFIASVLREVEKIAPDVLDDVMKFKNRGTAGKVKAAVEGEADSAASDTSTPLNTAATQDPGPGQSPRTAQPLNVEPAGPEPGSIRADRAMPPPRTQSEVDLSSDTVRTENILREACITRPFMDEHGDPELTGAAEAQDGLREATEAAPQSYREQEGTALQGAQGKASSQGRDGVSDLFADRTKNFADVGNAQGETARENARKRMAVSIEVNKIFGETQTDVTDRLDKMSTDVASKFDTETGAAVTKFEDFIRKNAEIYEKNWLDDLLGILSDVLFDSPPAEVWDFYGEGRRTFIADMETAIGKVADVVETGLREAKELVATGKRRVEEKLATLGDDLADFRSEISDQMNEKFTGLEGDIDKRQDKLVKGLAQRYKAALEEVRSIENKVREEYATWVDKAKDMYHAAKDFVTGWIEKLTSIVGGAATRIIRKPGTFLKNLGAGIVQGLTMFKDNIGESIKSAVVNWLTGNLGSAGIELPKSFDAKGLIGFAIELVGLGLSNIKKIAREVFGRTVVSAIEAGAAGAEHIKTLFDILASQGPAGLYDHLAAEFERLKGEIMEKIGKIMAESLIIAGIKKIVGIVSGLVSGGVGTVVTIVSTIIDVVLWFRDNAAQLAELVSTISSLAMAILNGSVSALANGINALLNRLLPIVLGFVGALVGIGGAVRKVQKVFTAIRRPATRAIRALFKRLKKSISKLLKKLSRKGKKGKKGRKNKPKYLSPKKVRAAIVQAMSKPAKATEPMAAIAETKSQAVQLKQKYQPKLKTGTIRITVLDQSAKGVESDGDIDFSVALSPAKKGAKKYTVRKMPLELVPFLSKVGKGPLYVSEYNRQLDNQEAAINAMMVEKWRGNREKFEDKGRDPKSAIQQQQFRKQFEKKMHATEHRKELKKLRAQGIALADAKVQADAAARITVEAFMKKNVALHDPDQVAGGSPAAIKRMGLKRVNSSIGSQWRSRAKILTTAVDRFLRKNGDPKAKMKVKITR